MAFQGYYIKINGNSFQDPAIAREGYDIEEDIETDMDSQTNASGELNRNILPTKRQKIYIKFPPMFESQWNIYYNILKDSELIVEFYSLDRKLYRTAKFYKPTIKKGVLFKRGSRIILKGIELKLISYGGATDV